MNPYSQELIALLSEAKNPEIALQQKAYMKNKFEFFGLKAPTRRSIYKPFLLKNNLPEKSEAIEIIKELYKQPQRELHYFAVELAVKYKKQFEIEDIIWIEDLITQNSWWDTVDFVAANIVGAYFQTFPNQIEAVTKKWMNSGNFWLQRTCLLFQLKYKENTDIQLLTKFIIELAPEKEFFIRKAIGWILREYAKTDAEWVKKFVSDYKKILSNLSQKEALKNVS